MPPIRSGPAVPYEFPKRTFGTWQNRLPQELRLAGISTLEQANAFLHDRYMAEFNRKFAKPAAEKGTAFCKCGRKDLDWVFSIQTERLVRGGGMVRTHGVLVVAEIALATVLVSWRRACARSA